MIRTRKDRIGEHRYASRGDELAQALVPLVVSERSALGFLRALAARWDVSLSGDADVSWPVEAWLPPHGDQPATRIRWDRALLSLDYDHARLVVHENPSLLSTLALARPEWDEEQQLEIEGLLSFPEPAARGCYVPTLPGDVIAPRTHRTVWTLTSPMAHGADEKSGNVNLFRRHRVIDALTGQHAYVPFVSGNAIRGLWRDMAMGRWLGLLGLKPTDLPPARAHALLSGGAVEAGADSGGVQNDVRRAARELCPAWDLLGGVTDQQIMSGRLRVHDARLVCRETAWQTHPVVQPGAPVQEWAASLSPAAELTTLRLGTRHAHKDLEQSQGQQMLFNVELLIQGSQIVHSFQTYALDGVSAVTLSCLADLLADFADIGVVGAQAARGMGCIAFDGYVPGPDTPPLPSRDLYLEHVREHQDAMRDWALRGPSKAPPPPPKGGPKGKRGKVAPEELARQEEVL